MRGLICALALTLASPVAAQDRMTPDLCNRSVAALASMAETAAGDVPPANVDTAGWCVIEGAILPIDSATTLKLDRLRWRAGDLARFVNDGLPPRSLEVEARGIHVVPQTGDPVFDYLLGVQMAQGGIDLSAGLRWDGVQRTLMVDQLSVDLGDAGSVAVSARVDGVDLTDRGTIQTSAGSAGLRTLSLTATFAGWFEAYALLPLGTNLLDSAGPPPAEQVAALIRITTGLVNALPGTTVNASSKAALIAFLETLPTPRGQLRVQVAAEPGLGAARLAPLVVQGAGADILDRLLEGVTISANWTPQRTTP